MPIHQPTGVVRKTTVTDPTGQGAIPIEDAVSGRHDRAAFGHVIFEPVDFIAKLAAQARYHGARGIRS